MVRCEDQASEGGEAMDTSAQPGEGRAGRKEGSGSGR